MKTTKQHEIFSTGNLLNSDGTLREAGFSKKMLQVYNRECIGKSKINIKEWDYYLVTDGKYGIALTIADNGYMGLVSASWLDFTKPAEHTNSIATFMPLGKMRLPVQSKDGICSFSNKRCDFSFETEPCIQNRENDKNKFDYSANRHLKCNFNNFKDGKRFICDIKLTDEPEDSMVISTPYAQDKKAFYYNQKIIGMKAQGWAEFDGQRIEFNPESALGLLDWGRGVWTYENTWNWGAASGYVDGHSFGWNIGYGFGDTTKASENMLFYDGKAHKLDRIRFDIPRKDAIDEQKDENDWLKNPPNAKVHLEEIYEFTKPWKFSSNDGRFEMDFVPIIDRKACMDFKILCSDQHQVFGKFSGTAVLDDGTKIKIKDFFGFAEKVHNKW
ncbi:MAG: DUF2804 domain-containing protein [Treponemataceae bacterium]